MIRCGERREYCSCAPRAETPDTDGNLVKVFPSSGVVAGEHDGPFVWLEVMPYTVRVPSLSAAAHLTVEQARVIRDALTKFIDAGAPEGAQP